MVATLSSGAIARRSGMAIAGSDCSAPVVCSIALPAIFDSSHLCWYGLARPALRAGQFWQHVTGMAGPLAGKQARFGHRTSMGMPRVDCWRLLGISPAVSAADI